MSEVLAVLLLVLVALLAALLVAPLESLGWWAGWFGRRDELERDIEVARQGSRRPSSTSGNDGWVVFLSGIGAISGTELLATEAEFLRLLDRRLPRVTVVTDVFPYAAGGDGLTGRRAFARLWRLLSRMRLRGGHVLVNLVNLRNLFQVLVSADSRYGPVFNYGTSRQVLLGLLRAGYRPEDRRPVFLLGSSGGGQIAIGAVPFLEETLGAPVEVISLGGVMSSDPGLRAVDHLAHIHGSLDSIQALGGRVFPSRWPTSPRSEWNRALREGRIEKIGVGPLRHQGTGGYLDGTTTLPEGDTCRDRTLATVVSVVERRLAVHAADRAAG
ncbi:MAG: hypothetical protein ACFCVF_13015 [Kineosporiaceae bacterium]